MIVSGEKWRNTAIHIHVSILPQPPPTQPYHFTFWLLWFGLPILRWTKVVRLGILVFVPDLWWKTFSFLKLHVICEFVINDLYYVETCLICIYIVENFLSWMADEFCLKPFLYITWFLSFALLMWYITLVDLWILNYPCFPRVNPIWS